MFVDGNPPSCPFPLHATVPELTDWDVGVGRGAATGGVDEDAEEASALVYEAKEATGIDLTIQESRIIKTSLPGFALASGYWQVGRSPAMAQRLVTRT